MTDIILDKQEVEHDGLLRTTYNVTVFVGSAVVATAVVVAGASLLWTAVKVVMSILAAFITATSLLIGWSAIFAAVFGALYYGR